MAQKLEIVLKISERCNINCTYCYFFENRDRSAFGRPPLMTTQISSAFADRIREGFDNGFLSHLQIDFHGGEPLLIGKKRFKSIIENILKLIPEDRVRFCIQTNAMLVDSEWIDLFAEFDVNVGVSLDGPDHIHNQFRIDHLGRPTHSRVMEGINQLIAAWRAKILATLSALVVIQPQSDAVEV